MSWIERIIEGFLRLIGMKPQLPAALPPPAGDKQVTAVMPVLGEDDAKLLSDKLVEAAPKMLRLTGTEEPEEVDPELVRLGLEAEQAEERAKIQKAEADRAELEAKKAEAEAREQRAINDRQKSRLEKARLSAEAEELRQQESEVELRQAEYDQRILRAKTHQDKTKLATQRLQRSKEALEQLEKERKKLDGQEEVLVFCEHATPGTATVWIFKRKGSEVMLLDKHNFKGAV